MTHAIIQNPWLNLPTEPPYILPEDLAYIQLHRNFTNLELGALPDAVIGGLDNAGVVFLALNPGFDERDITLNLKLPGFVKANRRNLSDPYGSRFYYFNGGFEATGGYEWWSKKLRPLLRAGATEADLRDKVMVIEYFPYHSEEYRHFNLTLPSQRFSFDLVRDAIGRQKTIVVMRAERLWLKAVPELATYPYMVLSDSQKVKITPLNLSGTHLNERVLKGNKNFDTILTKLTNTKAV